MWAQAGQRPGLVAVGSVLNNGRYRVNKRLNKGATAVVYAAEDLLTGRPVALKVVQCGSNKVPLNVVRREVSLSSTVAHENMVQLLDVFAEGTELIIVWELITGGDLLELLNECHGCMTEAAAAFYYVQLLRGVLHMHAMGYCHRDIKPENCMIEASTQRLKLIDFGLSKHLESVATLGVGTPDYMPPEMVRSQMKQQQHSQSSLPPYDAKAVDAWAMGVLLFLLVTGCYPFEDPAQPNNITATLLNVQAGRRQPLGPGISPGCAAVINGLLAADPQQRTRLEDLAYNPWLLQSAAAHAAKLGPLGQAFDPGNPAWILPAMHHTTNTTITTAATAATAFAAVPVPTRHSNNSISSTASTMAAQPPPASPPSAMLPSSINSSHAGHAGPGVNPRGAGPAAATALPAADWVSHQLNHQQHHHQYQAQGVLCQGYSQQQQQQQQQLLLQPAADCKLTRTAAGVAAMDQHQHHQQHQVLSPQQRHYHPQHVLAFRSGPVHMSTQSQQQHQVAGVQLSSLSFRSAANTSSGGFAWHSITSDSTDDGLQQQQQQQQHPLGQALHQQLGGQAGLMHNSLLTTSLPAAVGCDRASLSQRPRPGQQQQQQGYVMGLSPPMGSFGGCYLNSAGGGHSTAAVMQADDGCDTCSMDVDQQWAVGQGGAAASVRSGQALHLQQQQQAAAAGGFGSLDQCGRHDGVVDDARGRRTGFNWLQSLVRKRV